MVWFVAFILLTLTVDFFRRDMTSTTMNYGFSDYLGDVWFEGTSRFSEWVTGPNLDRQMPDAPDGWSKRAALQEDLDALNPPKIKFDDDTFSVPPEVTQQLRTASSFYMRGVQSAEISYVKDDSILFLSARFLPARLVSGANHMGVGISTANDFRLMVGPPFALVNGVIFFESLTSKNAKGSGTLIARFGEQIDLKIKTNASDADILDVLSGFDWDRLSNMQARPVKRVSETNIVALRDDVPSRLFEAAGQ